jgi:hypothetical protein
MTSRRWDRGRRSGSNGPLNIQGTLGTLLRTTLHQMGVVKEAVERQARSSLSHLDSAMGQRRERETLARLCELVWERARNGELVELAEHAEIAAIFDELAELEAHARMGAEHGGADDGTVSAADWAADRDPGRRGQQDLRVWRPSAADIPDPPDSRDHDSHRDASPAATGGPKHSRAEGREGSEALGAQERARAGAGSRPETAARSRSRRSQQRDDQAAGGIAFMEDGPGGEDDDLGPYMHEDDVPGRD